MVRKFCPVVLLIAFLIGVFDPLYQARANFQVGGYFNQYTIYVDGNIPGTTNQSGYYEYRLENRLNFDWQFHSQTRLVWEMRTRYFRGDLVESVPTYAETIERDNGYADLSRNVIDDDRQLLHYISDRLYLDWTASDWNLRVGRHRINWGINSVTNPNDIFNIYSLYEFDYPERPGADAVRIQHYLGPFSKLDLGFSPARDPDNAVAGLRYLTNTSGYDLQFIGGYYRNRAVIGGGWAGSIGQTGFKGEISAFEDLESDSETKRKQNAVVAISADHMFDNGVFLTLEVLYNEAGGREQINLAGRSIRADNPSISKHQLTGVVSYSVNPLLSWNFTTSYHPDEDGVFGSPSLDYSLTRNLDLTVLGQFFTGPEDSTFASASNLGSISIKGWF